MVSPSAPAALFDLSGWVALVTGATRGLGAVFAQALASAGAHVIINGRDQAAIDARCAALRADGFSASGACYDVTTPDTAAAIADIAIRQGRLDILVNNAANTVRKPLTDFTDDDWRTVQEVNLGASWRLSREAARVICGAPRRPNSPVLVSPRMPSKSY